MKRVVLKGVHRGTLRIDEPTLLVAESDWESTVEGMISVEADLVVKGLRICSPQTSGIKCDDPSVSVTAIECWVHGCGGWAGIESAGRVSVHRCLIERNGINEQFDHALYLKSRVSVQNSIIRDKALHLYPNPTGVVDRCLIVNPGGVAVYNYGDVVISNSTVVGEVRIGPEGLPVVENNGNLVFASPGEVQEKCYLPGRGLYWPRAMGLGGCYSFVPQISTGDAGLQWAKKRWKEGYMWKYGAAPFWPLFPGDEHSIVIHGDDSNGN